MALRSSGDRTRGRLAVAPRRHGRLPRYGRSVEAGQRRDRLGARSGAPDALDELLEIVCDRLRLADPAVVDTLLDVLGGTRIVHGHTPIASVLGRDPRAITRPLVSADGRVVERRPLPLRRRSGVRHAARRDRRARGHASADSMRSSRSAGSRSARRADGSGFRSSTSSSAEPSGRSRPSSISRSSTAPSRPANIV